MQESNQEPRKVAPLKSHQLQELTQWLNFALARLGPGPYQLMVLLFGGGVYAAEGSLLLLLSIIAKGLIAKWELSPAVAGAMASIIFAGILFGTIIGGFACDRFGRRKPILLTYLGITVFIIIGILVPNVFLLLVTKFFLGFALGFGVPAANAIVAESCPPAHRSNIYCMTMVLFSLGQLYSATILWVMSPMLSSNDMHWRMMLAVATLLPLVLLVLAYFFLLESPHWLVTNGKVSKAREVLEVMIQYQKMDDGVAQDFLDFAKTDLPLAMKTPEAKETPCFFYEGRDADHDPRSERDAETACERTPLILKDLRSRCDLQAVGLPSELWRLQALFSPTFRVTTSIMLFVTFATNFAYYGMLYGLPEALKQGAAQSTVKDGWSPAAGVFFSAVFEIPGVFFAIVLGLTVGRRTNMAFAFMMTALCLNAVVYALYTDKITSNIGFLSVLGMKLFLATGYIVVYLYILECYPTMFRASGLAFCMVFGRLGAFCCPFLYDGLTLLGLQTFWFFVVMAVIMILASALCWILPYETKDVELEGDAPPLQRPSFLRRPRRPSQPEDLPLEPPSEPAP